VQVYLFIFHDFKKNRFGKVITTSTVSANHGVTQETAYSTAKAAVQPLIDDSSLPVSNLISELKTEQEWNDPNEVKVVFDCKNNALYFSREPIPSNKKYNENFSVFKQVCAISFRRD